MSSEANPTGDFDSSCTQEQNKKEIKNSREDKYSTGSSESVSIERISVSKSSNSASISSHVLPLLSESASDLPSATTSSLSDELSKMSTSSSIGLMAQGDA